MEHVEQIAQRRTVKRNVRIAFRRNRVWKIVPAANRQRSQTPIPLDELQDRDMVPISVVDVAALGEVRNDDERNAWPIAKEIQRLHVSGVIETTAFVEGDDERGLGHHVRFGLQQIDNLLCHALEEINFGRGWVTI